jgi:hypothetical protein
MLKRQQMSMWRNLQGKRYSFVLMSYILEHKLRN